jgi:methyl-accepting chemotaxis protein
MDTRGLSGEALKRAQAYNVAMEKAEKALERQQGLADKLSGTVFGISGSEWFRSLTAGEMNARMQELTKEQEKLQERVEQTSNVLNDNFSEIAKGLKFSKTNVSEIQEKLGISSESAKLIADSFDDTGKFVGNMASIMAKMGPEADKLVKNLEKNKDISKDFLKNFKDSKNELEVLGVDAEELESQMRNVNERVFDLKKGFQAVGQTIQKSLLTGLLDFDKQIKAAQISTGINFTENTTQMAMLTSETAKVGLGVQETTELMGALGSELRTTNFDVLSKGAQDLAAMQKATGLAAADTAKLAKEFAMFGRSTEDTAKFAEETMRQASLYGVNGKEIMEDMAKNMSKMRQMGFTGGEQSLRKMALEAKRLGMNVDEIFDTAKKARSIEGAMEMAAELQLAGGSFAAIDPMQLLSAARKGPEELQQILGKMGSDIGSWNEKTGEFQFDPVDVDRLQMVADTTGQSLDSLQNMIAKNAEDVKKADLFGGIGASIDGLSDEEKAFIMNATKIGKDGKLELSSELEGIDDLSQVNQDTIKAAMEAEAKKKESLEQQAQQNMGLTESFEALKNSFINAFAVFQPVLEWLGDAVQALNNSMGGFGKILTVGIFALGGAMFSAAKWFMQGIALSKGFTAGVQGGGFFSKIKGAAGALFSKGGGAGTEALTQTAADGGKAGGASAGAGVGLKGLAQGLKSMGDAKVFKGILAMALLGPALIVFLPAIPGLIAITLLGAAAPLLIAGFQALAQGFGMLGKQFSQIMKGSLAMAVMGIALIPFAFAAQMMSEVDWLNVLAGVGIMALVVLGLIGLGMLLTVALPFLLIGAGGLIIAAGSMLIAGLMLGLAGDQLTKLIEPLQAISNMDWSGLFVFSGAIAMFGIALLASSIGLVVGAAALYLAVPMLSAIVQPFLAIAQQDWSGLATFATSLFALGPAMLAFALSGLMMFNPAMLLGMTMMLGSITVLTSLMSTLGPNLQMGADGIERMAEGVVKLEEAVSKLNMEKLEQLKNIMAEGGKGMGEFIAAINQGGGGKGGGGGETRHVVELQLNGRKLQEIIIKDNKHTT